MIYPIDIPVAYEVGIDSLLAERPLLRVGAQEMSLAWQMNKERFPIGLTLATAQKSSLWFDSEFHRIPAVRLEASEEKELALLVLLEGLVLKRGDHLFFIEKTR